MDYVWMSTPHVWLLFLEEPLSTPMVRTTMGASETESGAISDRVQLERSTAQNAEP